MWNSSQYPNVLTLKSPLDSTQSCCGEWYLWTACWNGAVNLVIEKRAPFWEISLKSSAIEMQGVFLLRAGSLAECSLQMGYHMFDAWIHIICLCTPYGSAFHLIHFSISDFFYYKLVIGLQIHTRSPDIEETVLNGEVFMSGSLMKAIDPQIP